MRLTMSLCLRTEIDPMTRSVFPEINAMLDDNEYQKSLRYVAKGRRMGRYEDMVDFLFSELFDMQQACFDYYAGDGPPLREILVPSQVTCCSQKMAGALRVARAMMEEKRERSWNPMFDSLI